MPSFRQFCKALEVYPALEGHLRRNHGDIESGDPGRVRWGYEWSRELNLLIIALAERR